MHVPRSSRCITSGFSFVLCMLVMSMEIHTQINKLRWLMTWIHDLTLRTPNQLQSFKQGLH